MPLLKTIIRLRTTGIYPGLTIRNRDLLNESCTGATPINSKTARCWHTGRLHLDFLLPDAPGRYNQPEHLNYIIPGTSWQGVYFLYPKSIWFTGDDILWHKI